MNDELRPLVSTCCWDSEISHCTLRYNSVVKMMDSVLYVCRGS